VLPPPKLTRYHAVVENAELRGTVNLRRVWSEYDGFDHRLSNGRYRRILVVARALRQRTAVHTFADSLQGAR